VGAGHHVDRVDLNHADPLHHLSEMTAINPTGRARIGEALGGQRHPTSLVKG
jgi:hypothetical protein